MASKKNAGAVVVPIVGIALAGALFFAGLSVGKNGVEKQLKTFGLYDQYRQGQMAKIAQK